jgi:Zn-dependent peptidase ImmA (M78 family)
MARSMPITGRVLEWALGDRDLSMSEAADRLEISKLLLQEWIDEDASPNKGQFNALVKLLGCTPSFLFLPEPPEESREHEIQFRRHPDAPKEIPSETASAMQTAQTVLRISYWLAERSDEKDLDRVPVPRARRNENPEDVAARLRTWLDWAPDEQSGPDATDSSAAKAMRAALQRRGIVVLHLTMDEGVTRGFSLHEDGVSLIAVNTRDHVRARLFSYAHELTHLALRDDSVCLTKNDRGTEGFCNRVAAALLMPAQSFRAFVKRRTNGRVDTPDNVVSVRNFFKVSLQAAAIRAETLGLAADNLQELIAFEVEPKGRGTYIPGNERTRPRVRVDQYGSGFVTSLLDAEDSGRLQRSQVLDLLRLSDRELESARSLAVSGASG